VSSLDRQGVYIIYRRGGPEPPESASQSRPTRWFAQTIHALGLRRLSRRDLGTGLAFPLLARHTGVVTDQLEMISTDPGWCTARP
jgi:hypothetical protein